MNLVQLLSGVAQLVLSVALPALLFYANGIRTDLRGLRAELHSINERAHRIDRRVVVVETTLGLEVSSER